MSSNDDKPLCSFCKERNTKYSCVSCRNVVCNVCSSPANPSTKGYDEEAKRVSVCRKCSEPQSLESALASTSEPPRKVQKAISSMFGKSSEPSTVAPSAISSSSFTKERRNPKQHGNIGASSSNEVRTVTASTYEKWKSDLSEYSAVEWLTYSVDASGNARSLRCKFCIMFEDKIKGLPNYSDIYIKGSTNYRVSAIKIHAKNSNGDPQHPHTVAYGKFLRSNGIRN